jgi:hypothetical protein
MPITAHTPTPRQDKHNGLIQELLAALEGVIDYAENEAVGLDSEYDKPQAQAEAKRAWKAIKAARAVLARAKRHDHRAGETPT